MSKPRWFEKAEISEAGAIGKLEAYLRDNPVCFPGTSIEWPEGDTMIQIERLQALSRALRISAATSARFARAQASIPLRQRPNAIDRLSRKVIALERDIGEYEWLRMIQGASAQDYVQQLRDLRRALNESAAQIRRSVVERPKPVGSRDKRSDIATMLLIRNLMTVWRVIFERHDTETREFRSFAIFAGKLCGCAALSQNAVRDRVLHIKRERMLLSTRTLHPSGRSGEQLKRVMELELRQIQFAIGDDTIVDV